MPLAMRDHVRIHIMYAVQVLLGKVYCAIKCLFWFDTTTCHILS